MYVLGQLKQDGWVKQKIAYVQRNCSKFSGIIFELTIFDSEQVLVFLVLINRSVNSSHYLDTNI